jgi:hypothetical protein
VAVDRDRSDDLGSSGDELGANDFDRIDQRR